MNKKLLLGLGSSLALSVPILAVTSCGDSSTSFNNYVIELNGEQTQFLLKINGKNLSTNTTDWKISESSINGNVTQWTTSNDWTLDSTSNSNQVILKATKDTTKGKKYSFIRNDRPLFSDFSTPFEPTAITEEGKNNFKGYQSSNANVSSNDSNKANIVFNSDLNLTFQFRQGTTGSQYIKMELPENLTSFSGYQGYNPENNIEWSILNLNGVGVDKFQIESGNILSSREAISENESLKLVGKIKAEGYEGNFQISINFQNQPTEVTINNISQEINNDKVIITITGSKLPTDSTKFVFKENNGSTSSNEWTMKTDPAATDTVVKFEATYANVMGKSFTVEVTNGEKTTSKEFTVVTPTINSISSQMTDKGDFELSITGTNLSSSKSLYKFEYAGEAISNGTTPSLDINNDKVELDWTSATNIVITIYKGSDNATCITKNLYGTKFKIKVNNQGEGTEFDFGDYTAPTGVIKDKLFVNNHEGTSDNSIATPLPDENITGDNLSFTFTTTSKTNTFMKISLPTSSNGSNDDGILEMLSGYKGYTSSAQSALTWALNEDSKSNFTFDQSTSELHNTNALTAGGNITATLTGTLTDTITDRSKTFTLSITFVLHTADVVISNEPTVEWIIEGDSKGKKVKVTFTGTNLPTSQDKWTIKEVTKAPEQPTPSTKEDTTSSSVWTIDTTSSPSATSITFVADFNKDIMGKTYSFQPENAATAKEVTVPTSSITQVSTEMDNNGDFTITIEGTNLSANLDTYVFTHKDKTSNGGQSRDDASVGDATTNVAPTGDELKTRIEKSTFDWESDKKVVITIQKVTGDGTNEVLTKNLYGETYEVNINGSTDKQEFTFASYVAPIGVTNGIFATSYEGNSQKPSTGTELKFEGNNLEWTINLQDSNNKYIAINLKHQDSDASYNIYKVKKVMEILQLVLLH